MPEPLFCIICLFKASALFQTHVWYPSFKSTITCTKRVSPQSHIASKTIRSCSDWWDRWGPTQGRWSSWSRGHWGCLSHRQKGARARWQLVYDWGVIGLSNLPSRHWYYSNWNGRGGRESWAGEEGTLVASLMTLSKEKELWWTDQPRNLPSLH